MVHNKVDLVNDRDKLPSWRGLPQVFASALTGAGVSDIETRIKEMVDAFNPFADEDFVAIGARHATALEEARDNIDTALNLLQREEPAELVASHLRDGLHSLGKITGKVDNEAMLDKLFASFCIGK